MSKQFDENEVKKAIAIMKPDGQLFECRMLEGTKIYSGYFTDAEELKEEAESIYKGLES